MYKRQVNNSIISGAVAGFASSFIVTPVERLKIMSQIDPTTKIIKRYNLPYLFKGLSSTFTREMPGFAIYFTSYEYMKKILIGRSNNDSIIDTINNLQPYDHFIMGGISGFLAWFFIYPQDLVKTQIQASTDNIKPLHIIKSIYKNNGLKGFFRGFHLALLRAIPLHSATFAMYEYLNKD